jgi:hypothetical protein
MYSTVCVGSAPSCEDRGYSLRSRLHAHTKKGETETQKVSHQAINSVENTRLAEQKKHDLTRSQQKKAKGEKLKKSD